MACIFWLLQSDHGAAAVEPSVLQLAHAVDAFVVGQLEILGNCVTVERTVFCGDELVAHLVQQLLAVGIVEGHGALAKFEDNAHLFGGQRHDVLILSHVEVDVARRVSNHSPTRVAELCVEGLAHAHGRVIIKLYAHVLVVESGQDAVRSPFVTAFVLCLCVVLVLTNGEIQSIGSLIVVGSDGIDSLLLCGVKFEDFCLGSRRNRCGVEAQATHQRRMLGSHFPRSIVTEVLDYARLCAVACRQTDSENPGVAEGADADALLRPVEVGVDGRVGLQVPQQDSIRTVCETLVGRSLTEVVVAVEPPDIGGCLRGLHVRGADK